MNEYILEVKEIEKNYVGRSVLDKVNLNLLKGEITTILGPSGEGKSTLLKLITGLEKYKSGQIYYKGLLYSKDGDIIKENREIGLVFQDYSLFKNMTVMDNLLLAPIKVLKEDRELAYKRAMDYIIRFKLEERINAFPFELSGGERQRVSIIRALMMKPDLLLLDEPTSSIDVNMKNEFSALIKDLNKGGLTILLVTHDIDFALKVSDRILNLSGGSLNYYAEEAVC